MKPITTLTIKLVLMLLLVNSNLMAHTGVIDNITSQDYQNVISQIEFSQKDGENFWIR